MKRSLIGGKDVMSEPLARRQQILEEKILPKLGEPRRYAGDIDAPLPDLIQSVRASGPPGPATVRAFFQMELGNTLQGLETTICPISCDIQGSWICATTRSQRMLLGRARWKH
jgi:hypothetical protein